MGTWLHLPAELSLLNTCSLLLSCPASGTCSWKQQRAPLKVLSQRGPGTVTALRIKKAKYALTLLSQIPETPFLSHGGEADERGARAALASLLGSFKALLGQPWQLCTSPGGHRSTTSSQEPLLGASGRVGVRTVVKIFHGVFFQDLGRKAMLEPGTYTSQTGERL